MESLRAILWGKNDLRNISKDYEKFKEYIAAAKEKYVLILHAWGGEAADDILEQELPLLHFRAPLPVFRGDHLRPQVREIRVEGLGEGFGFMFAEF
jgi:hypothetical protein